MRQRYIVGILLLVAFTVVSIVYPCVLRLARKWGVYDRPSARKTQKNPVPVLGGLACFTGIFTGILVGEFFFDPIQLSIALGAMTIMLFVGVWDDVKDLSATIRFLVEVTVVYLFMMMGGRFIDDFHGLWGIERIDLFKALPLSLIAGVGIINATNLIDGVNGYCSGFCMMACALFGTFFICTDNLPMGCVAFISLGATLPFFLHNVFGRKSLMFLGDGGSLMMGMMMTAFVFTSITSVIDLGWFLSNGFGVIPFSLAVMSIPVFDTIRVMTARILKGVSPFTADRTHLHHAFLDLGFTHAGTTMLILSMNLLIVASWFLSWKLGGSVDVQLYVVLALSILADWVLYFYFRYLAMHHGALERKWLSSLSSFCALEDTGLWRWMRRIVDRCD